MSSIKQAHRKRWLLCDDGTQAVILMRTQNIACERIADWVTYPVTSHGAPDITRPIRLRRTDYQPETVSVYCSPPNHEMTGLLGHVSSPFPHHDIGPPSLEKTRFFFDEGRFALEIYHARSGDGLTVITQYIDNSSPSPLPLPEWTRVFRPIEVTSHLTSAHIVALHGLETRLAPPTQIIEQLRPTTPIIALTGAATSLKKAALTYIQERMHDVATVSDEVIRAIAHVQDRQRSASSGRTAPDPWRLRELQLFFEQFARQRAPQRRQRAVVTDCGLVDAHVLPRTHPNLRTYGRVLGYSRREDSERYAAVIHIAPKEPSSEEQRAADRQLADAWKHHRRYIRVEVTNEAPVQPVIDALNTIIR